MSHEQLLSDLIRIKSLSGEEGEICQYIQGWFSRRDIESFVQGENLVVHLKGVDSTRAFIFNSHMDTVGPGDNYQQKWDSDPWTPTKKDGKVVGLGATDMKSGIAASMLTAQHFSKHKPPVDMFFTFVVREEVDGSGTQSFAEWFEQQGYQEQYSDLAGIFTEPTNLNEIEHGHRGNIFFAAETEATGGHSSRPLKDPDSHAVRKMVSFADDLRDEVAKWNDESPDKYFSPAVTIGEFTSIESGRKIVPGPDESTITIVDSPNAFPKTCVATFDLRTTPAFHEDAWKKLQDFAEEKGVKIYMTYPAAPAGFTDPNEKIIKVAMEVIENPELTVSQGSADLGFLYEKGVKAIILGPGYKDATIMHSANEYCDPEQIPQAVETYIKIVEKWGKK